jgi:hypothetical protein
MFTLNFLNNYFIAIGTTASVSLALVVSTSIAPSTGAAGAKCRLNSLTIVALSFNHAFVIFRSIYNNFHLHI